MRRKSFDPTAGERARAIREHPGVPQPISDPMDPRSRKPGPDLHRHPRRIVDPTDPRCGLSLDADIADVSVPSRKNDFLEGDVKE